MAQRRFSIAPHHAMSCGSVKEEIYEFNERHASNSHARLMRHAQKIDTSTVGFSNRDRLDLIETTAATWASSSAQRSQ